MNVEARLTELIGEPGRRLHTARSRNDQVATDLRLYARAGLRRHRGRRSIAARAGASAGARASTPPRCCPATRTCSARRW